MHIEPASDRGMGTREIESLNPRLRPISQVPWWLEEMRTDPRTSTPGSPDAEDTPGTQVTPGSVPWRWARNDVSRIEPTVPVGM